MTARAFECDLAPGDTIAPAAPRVRFNFSNGWSASLVVRVGVDRMDAMMASLACAPTGHWGEGKTELGPNEASAEEAIAWLYEVSLRGDDSGICPTCGVLP